MDFTSRIVTVRKQKEWPLRAGGIWGNPMNPVFTNALGRHLISGTRISARDKKYFYK